MVEVQQMNDKEFRDTKKHAREQMRIIGEYISDMTIGDSVKLESVCDGLGTIIDLLKQSDGKNKPKIP